MNEDEARRRLIEAQVAVLATTRRDGAPHAVPVTFALVGDTIAVAIDEKPKTTRALTRLDNIATNPAVAVMAHHYADDWSELWWVRADGTASVVDEPAPELRGALLAKYPHYEGAELGPWIVVEVERWVGWSAG